MLQSLSPKAAMHSPSTTSPPFTAFTSTVPTGSASATAAQSTSSGRETATVASIRTWRLKSVSPSTSSNPHRQLRDTASFTAFFAALVTSWP